MADPERQCPETRPHGAHTWFQGSLDRQLNCNGLPGPGQTLISRAFRTVSELGGEVHFPIQPSPDDPWVDAFYADSFTDAEALVNPRYAARGKHVHGPFPSYPQAQEWVERNRPEATHYTIRKDRVKRAMVRWFNAAPPQWATEDLGDLEPKRGEMTD